MIKFIVRKNTSTILKDTKYDGIREEYEKLIENQDDDYIPVFQSPEKHPSVYKILMDWVKRQSMSETFNNYPLIDDIDNLNQVINTMNSNNFASLRQKVKKLKYSEYYILKTKCPKMAPFLTAKLFLDLASRSNHTVFQSDLIGHLVIQSFSVNYYIKLLRLDKKNRGSLTKTEFFKFVNELKDDYEFVDELADKFGEDAKTRYAIFVMERFFAVLDPFKTGFISIENIIQNELFASLVKLADEYDLRPNPFDENNASLYLSHFDSMDGDEDGLLTKDDLLHMPGTRFTESFVDQVFDVLNPTSKADFAWFCNFKWAYTNLGKPWANQIFFDIMDIDKNNELNETEMNYFYHDLSRDYIDYFEHDPPSFQSYANELFDICGAKDSVITKSDFIQLTDAAKYVKHLVDLIAFAKWDVDKVIPMRGEKEEDLDF